jgi:mono/diheme cytochrome c family protein
MTALLLLSLSASLADEKALVPIEPAKLERREPVDYAKEIAPLLTAKCAGCHTGGTPQGGFSFTGPESLAKGGKKGGAGIVPGKPDESSIYLYMAHRKKPIMPPRSENADLSPQELALVRRWIEEGAPAPRGEAKAQRAVALALPAALVKPVRALAMHPGHAIVAAGRGNQVKLIDAKTGSVTATLADEALTTPDGKPADAAHLSLVESMAFSPDGTILATGSFREVSLWSVESKARLVRLGGFADKVTAIAWAPKGDSFATAGGAPTEEGEVKLFTAGGKPLAEFKSPHSDTVFGLAFSPDGAMLATAGADKFVRVFDPASGKLLKSFEGHTQHVLDVAWGPDGKRFVSAGADDFIKIWDYEKGEKVRDLKGSAKQVTRIAFAGKGPNFLTAGGDGVVRRWSIDTGDPSRTFADGKDFLYAVAATADGSLVASGGEDGLVRLFDGKSGQMLKTIRFTDKH